MPAGRDSRLLLYLAKRLDVAECLAGQPIENLRVVWDHPERGVELLRRGVARVCRRNRQHCLGSSRLSLTSTARARSVPRSPRPTRPFRHVVARRYRVGPVQGTHRLVGPEYATGEGSQSQRQANPDLYKPPPCQSKDQASTSMHLPFVPVIYAAPAYFL
jgi:hypothetical protein